MRPPLNTLVVFGLILVTSAWYFCTQDQVYVADGKGVDGVTYHKMYLHYKGVSSDALYDAPFNKRIGLPWLAAQLPMDATLAFLSINLLSGFAACLFLYFALRSRVRSGVVVACMLPMGFFIYSPIRFPNFYPFTVDPPAMMLCALAALLFSRKYFVVAGVALVASAFFREPGIYFALALGLAVAFNDRRHRATAALICILALAGAVATTLLQLPGEQYSQFFTVVSNLKNKMLHPLGLLKSAVCILMTLAPFLICKARTMCDEHDDNDEIYAIGRWFLLLCLALAFLATGDITRIFFIGYPLFVLMLAGWVSRADPLTIVLSSLAGLFANRFCLTIPQPSGTWPKHDVSGLFAITPDYAHPGVVTAFAAYWVACWFVIAGPGRKTLDALFSLGFWKKIPTSR